MDNGIPPENIPSEVPVPIPPPPSISGDTAALRKHRAKRRLITIIVLVIVLGGALWYFEKEISLPLSSIASFGSSVGTAADELEQNFSAPSPLTLVGKGSPKKANTLTVEGVIAQTNSQRAENGSLPALTENQTLDDIATLRVDDMFGQQYFAHVGPQGESAITVASSVGYDDIALGENLALGLFQGDEGVVSAWMNSPGHRANILDAHYTQIGVAVREGEFQGQETWIAVQVFGRPASACPAPDTNLKAGIDVSENQLSTMASELTSEKAAIAAMDPQSGPAYNAQAEEYNGLASQYNNLASETQSAITQYDSQVSAFNQCLAD